LVANRRVGADTHHGDAQLAAIAKSAQANSGIERLVVDGILFVAAPIFKGGANTGAAVGSVVIGWDLARISQAHFNSLIQQSLVAVACAGGMIGFVMIGTHWIFLRPVRELTGSIVREDEQLPDWLLAKRDELGILSRSFGELLKVIKDRSDAEIAQKSMELDVAMSNMSQGLLLMDGHRRLIMANRRYMEMFGVSENELYRGMELRDLLWVAYSAGNFEGQDFEDVYKERVSLELDYGTELTVTDILRGGEIISVRVRRTPFGGYVTTFTDVTTQVRNAERIEYLALHDGLTDLPNRVMFRRELDRALERARCGKVQAVFCIDLDHFKFVNDTLGHPVGDELLRQVSDRMRGCLRHDDLVARLGGDEFAILRSDVSHNEDPAKLAARVVETLSAPYEIDEHTVVIGASVGIALSPSDGADADRLMKSADLALYGAKAMGRGTWRYFEKDMDEQALERRALELDLRRALASEEFELHYQPIMDIGQERVICLEALLRWHHPGRGLIAPDDIIPLAEEIGLIHQIGAWILRRACLDAADWPNGVRVAVNLSPAQFFARTLVAEVAAALDNSGLDPDRLELEVTESVLIQDMEGALNILSKLRAMGVRIAMDDFGTGYSSLTYLRKFQFDKIKVDRSFVTDLNHDKDCLAIIRAVTGLGTSLGISTCAEGVDTVEQLHLLMREGFNEAQGFYYSKARPKAEITAMVEPLAKHGRSVG
jgi:diguanylate cyclase (GGDEF)-like protein